MSFVDADITVDPQTLVQDALNQLNTLLAAAGLPAWNTADADLLVIFLNTIAQLAADINITAAAMLDAAFRAYGTQLLGIPYQQGAQAIVDATFTFTEAAPDNTSFGIDAGLAVIIDGQTFYTTATTVLTGATTATVLLQSSDIGSVFNGLGGIGVGAPRVQLNNPLSFVANVTLTAETSEGEDAETDADYMDRLAQELTLQSPRAITSNDFVTLITSDIGEEATGVTIGRATAVDLYYPGSIAGATDTSLPTHTSLTGSCTIVSSSSSVTLVTPPLLGAFPAVGATVTGTNIPTSTTVATVNPGAGTFTLSHNATGSATETLTITAWTNVENCTTLITTDTQGQPLTSGEMTAISNFLNLGETVSGVTTSSKRLVCTQVFIDQATYYDVYVTAQVQVLPSYVGLEATVISGVQNQLQAFFNPTNWGSQSTGKTGSVWLNASQGSNIIHYSSLYNVIMQAPGVAFVVNSTLTLGAVVHGGSAPSQSTTDITMLGPAPIAATQAAFLTITTT